MPLKVGDRAPDFTLTDHDQKPVSLSDILARGPFVLFFYPKDHTHGCTRQSCSFRDHYSEFQERGAQIFGISADDAASHTAFRTAQRLPFPLLSDPGGKVAKLFGVKKVLGLLPGRHTFLIDKDGIVRLSFSSSLTFEEHADKALEALAAL